VRTLEHDTFAIVSNTLDGVIETVVDEKGTLISRRLLLPFSPDRLAAPADLLAYSRTTSADELCGGAARAFTTPNPAPRHRSALH
jgi:hypothetical protein